MTQLSSNDPMVIFHEWLDEATGVEMNDPNAMCLATANKAGVPSARMVLLKNADETGFSFNTNKNSRKAQDLLENPVASLVFHWKSLQKQVRIEGTIITISDEQNQEYFQTRATISQLGAWASDQSKPLKDKQTLLDRIKFYEEKFKDEEIIPCPEYWGGFKIIPSRMEFWIEGNNRLHDRFVFTQDYKGTWQSTRLYP